MKTYTIPKGEHYSMHLPKPYLGLKKSFNLKVLFDDSCRYDLGDINQLDINKLWGVSFGFHQDNSIRIGWKYNLSIGQIELFSYIYQAGTRLTSFISSIPMNLIADIEFSLYDDRYSIVVNNEYEFNRPFHFPKWQLKYYLFPYFGGNKVAPHDINIKLEVQ